MRSQNLILLALFALAAIGAKCQDEQIITKIEFTSLTRGYQKEVFISPDSLTRIVNNRGENSIFKRKLADGEWDNLVKSVGEIKMDEIPQLPSPTTRRAFDGARHSTLTIRTKGSEQWQHSFDDELPHEKLHPLMEVIKKMDGSETN